MQYSTTFISLQSLQFLKIWTSFSIIERILLIWDVGNVTPRTEFGIQYFIDIIVVAEEKEDFLLI